MAPYSYGSVLFRPISRQARWCSHPYAMVTYSLRQPCGDLNSSNCMAALRFLAETKQLYEWFSPSVCLSVCPSVRHTFLTMFPSSYHHEIFRSYYQWQKWRPCKRWGQRSKVEGTTQLNRFRTVTPVWIHIWWWNDAYSLIMLRRGALVFFKVIRQISRSHG